MSISTWLVAPRGLAARDAPWVSDRALAAFHVGAEGAIGLALLGIAAALIFFFVRRKRRRYAYLLVPVVVACALTHLAGMSASGRGAYGVEVLIEMATAIVAAVTGVILWVVTPRILAVPTAAHLTERLVGHSAALRALAEIRPALFAGLAAAPAERSLALSSGEATARLVQDVDAIESLFVRRAAPWAAVAAAMVAASFVALANVWALPAFLGALAAQIAVGRWVGVHRSSAPAAEALRAAGVLKDGVQAYAAASAELRCLGVAGAVVEQLMLIEARLGAAKQSSWRALAEMGAVQPALSGVAVAGVLALCAHAGAALAALAALASAVALERANGLLLAFDREGAVATAAERLDDILAAPAPTASEIGFRGPAALTLGAAGRIHQLRPGERWALLGPSGVGKTRLLEALVGLRQAACGEIALCDRPPHLLDLAAVRAQFAYAAQDARMIGGTVRENLALGCPQASDSTLRAALDTAQLADRIGRMPAGLDAWIGEGGARLSGGERRRLSLARALLRPAPWLLLDEPTEGLDGETEARVIEAVAAHLARSRQGLILVSHRLAPLALCDHRIEF